MRFRGGLLAALWLGSIGLAVILTYQATSRISDAQLRDLQRRTGEAEARADSILTQAALDSTGMLRRIAVAQAAADSADRARQDVERRLARLGTARSATRQTGATLADHLVEDARGTELLVAHLESDSLEAAAADSVIASQDRRIGHLSVQVTALDSALFHARRLADARLELYESEHELRVEWQAAAVRLDRQANPPFGVRVGRAGFEGGVTYLVATEAFDMRPLDAGLLAAGVPLAKCVVRRLPLVGRALASECVFD